jgi:hypothetical protein
MSSNQPFRISQERCSTALLGLCLAPLTYPAAANNRVSRLTNARPSEEQPPKSIGESVNRNLQYGETSFLGMAEAMPEDKYAFIPTAGKFDGVRSFAEQVKHVACAQFAFFNEFEGWKPPTIAKMAATTLRCCRVAQKCPSKWATS